MYIGRRTDGTIYGTWTCKQPDDEFHQGMEELPDDHLDVIKFLKSKPITKKNGDAILRALIKKGLITQAEVDAEIGK